MKRSFWILTIVSFVLALALGAVGYFLANGFSQSLVANVATELLALCIALLLVNYYLTSSEKRGAAAPLVKLIEGAIGELHNDLFIRHWDKSFGIDGKKALLNKYQSNRRNPKAFSPDERDKIHAAIMMEISDLVRVYDVLIEQFRELSMITGWSFDPSVTAAALEARLNFVKFKSLCNASDSESKYQIIEAYLDGEAAAGAVYEMLVKRLGIDIKAKN